MLVKEFTKRELKFIQIVFYFLIASPIVFLTILLFGEYILFNPTSDVNKTQISQILPVVFGAISILILVSVFGILLPLTKNSSTYPDSINLMLISMVLLETIIFYGLSLGFLDLIILNQRIRWSIIVPFILSPSLFQYYLLSRHFKPKLESLLGSKFSPISYIDA